MKTTIALVAAAAVASAGRAYLRYCEAHIFGHLDASSGVRRPS